MKPNVKSPQNEPRTKDFFLEILPYEMSSNLFNSLES